MSASNPVSSPSITPAVRRPRLSSAAIAWIVALVALAPLLPTLRAAFVYDDTTIVRDNPMLRGWGALARVWSSPYWPSEGADVSGLYRPLHVALLAVVWNVADGAARAFHVYALVLYGLVAASVWWLLRRGVGTLAATVAALWFAAHPLHVEVVASAANSSELLVVGFTLALVWVIVRADRASGAPGAPVAWPYAFAVAALAAAALLSKESGLFALPLALVTAWGWRGAGDPPADAARTVVRGRGRLVLACGVALAAALLARAVVLGAPVARVSIAAPGLDALSAPERVVAMLSLWPRIVGMIAWPGALAPYYGPTILPSNRAALATLALVCALIAAVLVVRVARRGDRRLLVAAAWIGLSYLPASNLLTATGQLIADRTLFGATVGVAMVLAWALDRLPRRASTALVVVLAAVIVRDTVQSARYARAWSSHRALWERLVEAQPAEYRGWQLLGIDAREHGDSARAVTLLARAFAMEPRDRRGRFEYGQALYATGRYAQAAEVLAPLLASGDVRREAGFVAMYLDAVGRSRGADAVVAAGTPLLRSESAVVAAVFVGAAHERQGRLVAADSAYAMGLRRAPGDSLLLARRAAVERALARR